MSGAGLRARAQGLDFPARAVRLSFMKIGDQPQETTFAATIAAERPARVAIPPSVNMSWARLVFGWIAAQSLLTLMPIAPAWGDAGLLIAGGAFVLVALSGVARLLFGGIGLAPGRGAVEIAGIAIPWAEIEGWQLTTGSPRRLEIVLSPDARRRLPAWLRLALLSPAPRRLAWRAGELTATLGEAAAALRATRPELERRPA